METIGEIAEDAREEGEREEWSRTLDRKYKEDTMTSKCTIHNVDMEERESKTKNNPDGSPKTYFGHMDDGKMCFGEPLGKARRNGNTSSVAPTKTDPAVFDAKDRTFMAQTAWNAAATISAARIAGLNEDLPLEDIKSTADKIYKDILEKRNG